MDEFCKKITEYYVEINEITLDGNIMQGKFSILRHYDDHYGICYDIVDTELTLTIINKGYFYMLFIEHEDGGDDPPIIINNDSKFITQLNDYINSEEDFERKLIIHKTIRIYLCLENKLFTCLILIQTSRTIVTRI